MRKRGITKLRELSKQECKYLEDILKNLMIVLKTMNMSCDFIIQSDNSIYSLSPRLKSARGVMVVYNTSTQETQIMYTNSKKEVHDKFQKGLLRNMVEVMGILEANSISKVTFGTGKIIAGYQTEDGYYLETDQAEDIQPKQPERDTQEEESIRVQMCILGGERSDFYTTPSRFYHDISKRIVEQQPPCSIAINARQYGTGTYDYILKGRKPDSPRFVKHGFTTYTIPVRKEKRRTLKFLNPEKNSYKYYTIWHEGGQTLVEYGRVGVEGTGTDAEKRFTGSYRYPADMYWIKYYEKIAKGYQDYTQNMESEVVDGRKTKDEEVTEIYPSKEYEKLYTYLSEYTKNHLSGLMSAETRDRITTRDIVEARKYLLKLSKTKTVEQFNTFLKEVLLLIPRYSERISDMMASSERDFQKILDREEDLIQAVEGIIIDSKNVVTPKKESDPLGCKIEKLSKEDWEIVNRAVNYKGSYKEVEVIEAYKITTSKPFNPQGYATEFLWHGSRTENWISIIKNGLTTRPSSNIITTGSLFGAGIYFAPSPYKSYGYTSATTAYWTRGDYKKSAYGVMALCEVAVGKSYIPDTDGYYTKSYLEKRGFQSLWAKGKKTRMYGSCLKNDEVVIYSDNQVRIRYIVIVKER